MRFARGLAALVLLTSVARAERLALDTSDAAADKVTTPQARDAREALANQIAAELQSLAKTVTIVDDKLADAEAARLRRVRAAYRILRAPRTSIASSVDSANSAADRMAAARRRAAARLLLARDRAERDLLADEATLLQRADTTLRMASEQVATAVLPASLVPPAKGTIARRFGTIVHERSRAVLARRGIDLEVAASAHAVAPADGVVRYAGAMRGLDHGVILDHGEYFTVVAKLAPVAIPVGTKVLQGDRIGRAARARVYFEVRAKIGPGGLPIDPEPLLKR